MKLTFRQQKLATENNLYSVREDLENLCSYYKPKYNENIKSLQFYKLVRQHDENAENGWEDLD